MRRLVVLLLLSFSVVTNLWAKREVVGSKGANVVGVVTCDGKPMEGVLVSDGALFARTDSLGVYSLASLKYYGSLLSHRRAMSRQREEVISRSSGHHLSRISCKRLSVTTLAYARLIITVTE